MKQTIITSLVSLILGVGGWFIGKHTSSNTTTKTNTVYVSNRTELDSLGRVIKHYVDTNKTLVVENTKIKTQERNKLNFFRFKHKKSIDSLQAQKNFVERNYKDSLHYLIAEQDLIIQDTISKVKKPLQDSIVKVWLRIQ